MTYLYQWLEALNHFQTNFKLLVSFLPLRVHLHHLSVQLRIIFEKLLSWHLKGKTGNWCKVYTSNTKDKDLKWE